MSSVPGVLCGVVITLLATGTTLNIESFMGSIVCIGVSVSNSMMLAAFIAMEWHEAQGRARGHRRLTPRTDSGPF